jgi:hypothetical protein
MTKGDAYRVKAAELFAKAKAAQYPEAKAEHAQMAAAYMRLAEQADRTAPAGIAGEGAEEDLQFSR